MKVIRWVMMAVMIFFCLSGPALYADLPEGEPQGERGGADAPVVETPEVLFQGLEAKRLALVERAEAIRLEEKKIKELKTELDATRDTLETLRQQIEISLSRLEAKEKTVNEAHRLEEEKKIKQLVKLYSSMKSKKAAAIVNSMDIVIAERLFMNLKGDVAGKILAYVEPDKAARISERLAETLADLPEVK